MKLNITSGIEKVKLQYQVHGLTCGGIFNSKDKTLIGNEWKLSLKGGQM